MESTATELTGPPTTQAEAERPDPLERMADDLAAIRAMLEAATQALGALTGSLPFGQPSEPEQGGGFFGGG